MAAMSKCKLCGLDYETSAGRLHGQTFKCKLCDTTERTMRRNLGSQTGLQNFSVSETHEFFRALHKEKQQCTSGRLQWTTVRACLVTSLTNKSITTFRSKVKSKYLPLCVWKAQGWDEDTVLSCPSEWSDDLKTQTYMVPIKEMSWAEQHEEERVKVLRQEQDIVKKRKQGPRGAESEDGTWTFRTLPRRRKAKSPAPRASLLRGRESSPKVKPLEAKQQRLWGLCVSP